MRILSTTHPYTIDGKKACIDMTVDDFVRFAEGLKKGKEGDTDAEGNAEKGKD